MKKIIKIISLLSIVFTIPVTTLYAQENDQEIQGKINFLLLGLDSGYEADREDSTVGARSDAIIIATLDTAENTLTLSSIPRDSLVDIPGYGPEKVTHAYAYGGLDLTRETLENWLQTDFDYYVSSNMPGFVTIMNTLGGITVVPPATFDWWDTQHFVKDVPRLLDGDAALAYARERMTSGGDYARQFRMRDMLQLLIEKVANEGDIDQYREAFENRDQYIETDLSFKQIKDFYNYYKTYQPAIKMFQLNGEGQNDDGLGYIDLTDENSLNDLRETISK